MSEPLTPGQRIAWGPGGPMGANASSGTFELQDLAAEIDAVVSAERETLLAIVEHHDDGGTSDVAWVARQIAAAIRAREAHDHS